ncbi:MAG: cysteine-rich CWC family protein [Chthoniobacterales bacterium]|nr:cysteine-rich CWC family protein [Chthoniobacterales bacterium]
MTLAGCWCSEVKLSERLRSTLRARYQSCLCRSCLEKFAEADEEEAAV